MALKPNRTQNPWGNDITWYFDNVMEAGGVASRLTSASTAYPGDTLNRASYAANPSGAKPVGLMVESVVSFDTNRQHDNWFKAGFQERVGQKALVDRGGRYHTNMIAAGVTPSGGQDAYLAASGLVSNLQATGAPRVGTWLTGPDADGYAVLQVELM